MPIEIKVVVSEASAIRRGWTSAGEFKIALPDELIASLTVEQRETLANAISSAGLNNLDAPTPEAVMKRVDQLVAERQQEALAEAQLRARRQQEALDWLASHEGRLNDVEIGYWELPPRSDLLDTNLAERVRAVYRKGKDRQRAAAREAADARVASWLARPDQHFSVIVEEGKRKVRAAPQLGFAHGEMSDAMRTKYFERLREIDNEIAKKNGELAKMRGLALADAIAKWGSPIQQRQFSAGLLDAEKVGLELARAHLFGAFAKILPKFKRLTGEEVGHSDECNGASYAFTAHDADDLPTEAFLAFERAQALATALRTTQDQAFEVTPRAHGVYCDDEHCDSAMVVKFTALITITWYGFSLSQEYGLEVMKSEGAGEATK